LTWSYSGDPSNSAEDAVRFLVNDTDEDRQEFQDEEIAWLLTEADDDVYRAASYAARRLHSRYAAKIDKAVGDLKISYSDRAKAYSDLVTELEAKIGVEFDFMPYMGGSLSETENDYMDTDKRPNSFRVGMHDEDDFTDVAERRSPAPWIGSGS
jgi:uncharacterized UPF0160 family protein